MVQAKCVLVSNRKWASAAAVWKSSGPNPIITIETGNKFRSYCHLIHDIIQAELSSMQLTLSLALWPDVMPNVKQ